MTRATSPSPSSPPFSWEARDPISKIKTTRREGKRKGKGKKGINLGSKIQGRAFFFARGLPRWRFAPKQRRHRSGPGGPEGADGRGGRARAWRGGAAGGPGTPASCSPGSLDLHPQLRLPAKCSLEGSYKGLAPDKGPHSASSFMRSATVPRRTSPRR